MSTYNMSRTEYPNGTTTVKVYDGIVGNENPPKQRKSKKSANSKTFKENLSKEEQNALELDNLFHSSKKSALSPYTERLHILRLLLDFGVSLSDEELGILRYHDEQNLLNSVRRTKRKIMELARCASWSLWCTLTFDPKKIDRYDFKLCSKRMREWLQWQRKQYAPDLQFLVVPETHKDGAWHFHALLGNIGSMELTSSGKYTINNQEIFNLSGWKWGFTSACFIDSDTESLARIASYVSKYMTKECYQLAVGAHRYYASNNLGHPRTVKWLSRSEESKEADLKTICEEEGKSIVFTNEHKGYIDVTYYELM